MHLQAYFKELWDKNQKCSNSTAGRMGYGKLANNINQQEEPGKVIVYMMKEVAIAATADKEHIQQMSTTVDDLVAIIKCQQAIMENQSTQITTLTASIGKLTDMLAKLSVSSAGNYHHGGRGGNCEKTGTNHKESVERMGPHKCGVCDSTWHIKDDCWELDKNKGKCHEEWKIKFEKE